MKPRPRTSATSGIAAIGAEQLAEKADLRLQAQQRLLALEHLEARDRGGAAERVAGEGVTVKEGAAVLGLRPRKPSYTRSVASVAASGR